MKSQFNVPDEAIGFVHGMLTRAAYQQFQGEVRKLRARFSALHDQSADAPLAERRGTSPDNARMGAGSIQATQTDAVRAVRLTRFSMKRDALFDESVSEGPVNSMTTYERKITMSPPGCINEIARSLRCLVPHWLPAYDQAAYATKVNAECGYSSDTMAAAEFNTRMFEEVVSFVQLCAAFARLLDRPADQQYACVRNDMTEINDLLAQHAGDGCPTYTGLLTLFVERGVLERRTPHSCPQK